MVERRARLFAEDDLRTGALGEFLVTAHKISVQVRFDHVLEFEFLGSGFGEILVNVTLRIDNRGFAFRADQIRSVGQTSQIELFEIHFVRPLGSLYLVLCTLAAKLTRSVKTGI